MKYNPKQHDKVIVTSKSDFHEGQTGTIVSFIGSGTKYCIIKVDDETYKHAFKSNIGDGKYLQIDIRNLKEIHA